MVLIDKKTMIMFRAITNIKGIKLKDCRFWGCEINKFQIKRNTNTTE